MHRIATQRDHRRREVSAIREQETTAAMVRDGVMSLLESLETNRGWACAQPTTVGLATAPAHRREVFVQGQKAPGCLKLAVTVRCPRNKAPWQRDRRSFLERDMVDPPYRPSLRSRLQRRG